MTPDAIEQAVQVYFQDNWTVTPFTFGNLDPKTQVRPWVCFFVRLGETSEAERGKDGRGKRPGLVMVQIFTPAAKGTRAGHRIGGQIELLFRKQDVGKVYFGEPYTKDSGVRGTDQQHTTTCPFWTWVGE